MATSRNAFFAAMTDAKRSKILDATDLAHAAGEDDINSSIMALVIVLTGVAMILHGGHTKKAERFLKGAIDAALADAKTDGLPEMIGRMVKETNNAN